jgi:plastocyanin domain-containing protein
VQKGIPVKWVVSGEQVTSCNNEIIVPSMKIEQKLKRGETVINFVPQDRDIPFSCWMGMLRGVIKVVDK